MHRLIYTSRSLVGPDPDAVDAIVDGSIRRNRDDGVTGMLWSDGAHFAQVLEGERKAVTDTMHRIRGDPRHTEVEVVLDRAIAHRMFGHWSMVLPDAGTESTAQTTFLIGFAVGQDNPAARRLYDIVMSAYERDC